MKNQLDLEKTLKAMVKDMVKVTIREPGKYPKTIVLYFFFCQMHSGRVINAS